VSAPFSMQYPRLLTMISTIEGAIGTHPSISYRVANILYQSETQIDPFQPLAPKDVIQAAKNQKISAALDAIAGNITYNRGFDSAELTAAMRKIGEWITETILPSNCLACCNGGTLPSVIEIITTQHEIPWELSWLQGDFLAARVVHSRLPFVTKARSQPTSYGTPPRMAIIVGKTAGLFSADEEINTLAKLYEKFFASSPTIFTGERVTVDLIRDLMIGSVFACDIIHFIGHGNCTTNHVWLELLSVPFLTDNVPASINGNPLVFWNSCYGGAYRARPSYQSSIIDAFGSQLLSNGAGHFVGPMFPVPDFVAKDFSSTFYEAVFGGSPIGEALYQAKRVHAPSNPLVNAYVLYGSVTSRIVANEA
jgi:CHAT domain